MATAEDPLGFHWFRRTGHRGGQRRYRWTVKTASDPAASRIATDSPQETRITDLTAEPVPGALAGEQGTPPGPVRQPGVESSLYTLSVLLLRYHPETDGDYHLVLSDDAGNTMIGEIPDPAQVDAGSPFFAQIQSARAAFEAQHPEARGLARPHGGHGQPGLVEVNESVQLTGIGFFDFVHGQDGVARNGVELHPVVDIAFQS